jgi:hypothetical protein
LTQNGGLQFQNVQKVSPVILDQILKARQEDSAKRRQDFCHRQESVVFHAAPYERKENNLLMVFFSPSALSHIKFVAARVNKRPK